MQEGSIEGGVGVVTVVVAASHKAAVAGGTVSVTAVAVAAQPM
jgi:hypothetical protein